MGSFHPSVDKVVEAIVFLTRKFGPLDVFHIAKTLFYADKEHLNRFGRPVTGDRYVAMQDGPVPSKAYDLFRQEFPFIGPDELERVAQALEFVDGTDYRTVRARREADLSVFSDTDLECLASAGKTFSQMPFSDLWRMVHEEPAYIASREEGGNNPDIPYERLVDPDNPNAEEILEELGEGASQVVL